MEKTEQEPTKQLKSERRLTNFFATAFSSLAGTIGSFFMLSRLKDVGENKTDEIYSQAIRDAYNVIRSAVDTASPETTREAIAKYSQVILEKIPQKLQTENFRNALRTQAEAYGAGPVYHVSGELRNANNIVGDVLNQANTAWAAQNGRNALITTGAIVIGAATVTLGAVHLIRKRQAQKQPASHTEKLAEERVQAARIGAQANQR